MTSRSDIHQAFRREDGTAVVHLQWPSSWNCAVSLYGTGVSMEDAEAKARQWLKAAKKRPGVMTATAECAIEIGTLADVIAEIIGAGVGVADVDYPGLYEDALGTGDLFEWARSQEPADTWTED